jgi:hypothetical protein
VPTAAGHALCKIFLLQFIDDIAVLGMDHGQRAQFLAARERGEHLVVLDHQRALVGHEMLERVHAHLDRGLHLVEDLLVPAGDRHVEADIRGDLVA